MSKNIPSFLIAFLFLIPHGAFPSETRVNAVGGLSLVMTDETADINPFTLGNPAGLCLLPPVSRFDVAGPWYQLTPATNAAGQIQAYGSLSQLSGTLSSSSLLNASDSAFKYQGLILFPTNQWAFQLSGDLLHATNQLDPNSGFEKSVDRTRGMARTGYDFGPFTLGTEIRLEQTNKDFPALFAGGLDGQGTASALISNSGLLMNFPLDHEKQPSVLRIGGLFEMQVPPAQEKDHLTVNAGSTVNLTAIFQSQSYMTFGPEVYLDVPDSFQAAVITRFNQSTVNGELDSSNPGAISNIPSYKLSNTNATAVVGLFKSRFPLAGTLRQRLSVNTGGYLVVDNIQSSTYSSNGNTTQTLTNTDLQAGMGVGVENAKDFTVGLQATLESQAGTSTPGSGTAIPISYFGYVISAGGERWLNKHWAFRVGINFEDDYDGGSTLVTKPFFFLGPGNRVVMTTLNAGVGFQDTFFRSDFMLWTGQPSLYDSSNPDAFATQVGVELSASVLFN